MSDPWTPFDEVVGKLEYRNASFRIDRTVRYGTPFTFIVLQTFDSVNPMIPMRIHHMFELPSARELSASPLTEDDIVQWFMDRVVDAERHEAMEFFKYDGRKVFNPHHEWGRSYMMRRISDNPLILAERKKHRGD